MAEAGESSESSCGEKKPNLMYTSTSRGSHKRGGHISEAHFSEGHGGGLFVKTNLRLRREKVGTQTKDVDRLNKNGKASVPLGFFLS